MGNGVAVPKGRFKLPRQVKAQAEDRILVFAEGKLAEEAKKAAKGVCPRCQGADIPADEKCVQTKIVKLRDLESLGLKAGDVLTCANEAERLPPKVR